MRLAHALSFGKTGAADCSKNLAGQAEIPDFPYEGRLKTSAPATQISSNQTVGIFLIFMSFSLHAKIA